MKTKKWIGVLTLPFFVGAGFAQEIQQAQVPSAVVTSFQQSFPKTYDVEWEMKGENYKVEFETSLTGPDHDVWYDKTGKMIMHKEEIAKSDLPQKVVTKINTEFNSYRVDDVKKITEDTKIVYTVELKKITEEWKVTFDVEGNVINKVAD